MMDRRDLLKLGGASLASLSIGRLYAAPEAAAKKPNLLFVMSDEHAADVFGRTGIHRVETKNFDRFAQDSLVVQNAFVNCPICTPSRGTLFTGLQPMRNGVFHNGLSMYDGTDTFPGALQRAGYCTGYIGKWHLDTEYTKEDIDQGRRPQNWGRLQTVKDKNGNTVQCSLKNFVPPERRRYFDFWHGYEHWNHLWHGSYFRDQANLNYARYGWTPTQDTDAAIEFLRKVRRPEKPFALFVSYNPPHHGSRHRPDGAEIPLLSKAWYTAPDEYQHRYEGIEETGRRNMKPYTNYADRRHPKTAIPGYYGAVHSIDDEFGRLLAELEAQGLSDNTVVVYTSDHGEMLGSHGWLGKSIWYENSIGVPFMIRWPNHIKPGQVNQPFSNVHVMPSLLGLLGAAIPSGLDGRDLSGLFLGAKADVPEVSPIMLMPALRRDRSTRKCYWLNRDSVSGTARSIGEWRGIKTSTHTYAVQYNFGEWRRWLFDNRNDPWQMHPIQETKPMKAYHSALVDYLRETQDPFLQLMESEMKV